MLLLSNLWAAGRAVALEFAADGSQLVAVGAEGVALWSGFPTRPKCRTLPKFIDAVSVRTSACGRYRISAEYGLSVRDLCDEANLVARLVFGGSHVRRFDTAPGGRLVFTTFEAERASLRCHQLDATRAAVLGPELWRRALDPAPGFGPVCLNDQHFLIGWSDQQAGALVYEVCALATGEPVRVTAGRELFTGHTALDPRGGAIAGFARGRLVVLPTADLASPIAEVELGGRKQFTAVAFHPSGRYLGATCADATVRLYDTATWTVARSFNWKLGPMRYVAFSPDGALAAAASDTNRIVVWDVDV